MINPGFLTVMITQLCSVAQWSKYTKYIKYFQERCELAENQKFYKKKFNHFIFNTLIKKEKKLGDFC